jgi:hypothetical protein
LFKYTGLVIDWNTYDGFNYIRMADATKQEIGNGNEEEKEEASAAGRGSGRV